MRVIKRVPASIDSSVEDARDALKRMKSGRSPLSPGLDGGKAGMLKAGNEVEVE